MQLEIKISGYKIEMLKFADDIAIIAENEKGIKKSLETMEEKRKMNQTKTKILVRSRENNIRKRI